LEDSTTRPLSEQNPEKEKLKGSIKGLKMNINILKQSLLMNIEKEKNDRKERLELINQNEKLKSQIREQKVHESSFNELEQLQSSLRVNDEELGNIMKQKEQLTLEREKGLVKITQYEQEIENNNENYSKAKSDREKLKAELDKNQLILDELQGKIDKLSTEESMTKEKNSNYNDNIKDYEERIAALKLQFTSKNEEYKLKVDLLQNIQKEQRKLEEELKKKRI